MTRAARRFVRAPVLGIALGLLLAPLLIVLGPAGPASAHASVVSTTPGNGIELDAAPTSVTVTFDEAVTLTRGDDSASVIDAEGIRVDAGHPVLDDARTTLTIPLIPDLPVGSYIASWSVVSADTHPVGGSIQFGYGVPASTASAPPPPTPSAGLTLAVGAAKGLLYLGLVLALGLFPAALVLGADDGERRRIVRASWLGATLAVAASAAQLLLQFLWILSAGSPLTTAQVWPAFAQFATSSFGVAVVVRVVAVVLAAVVLAGRPNPWRVAMFAALGLVAVATVVVNGHGGAGSPLVFVSTALHATGAIAWLGGLALLGWLLLRGRLTAERLRRMPRWSLYAGIGVAAIAASGLVQAVVQVAHPEALFETTYGLILLAKLGLVAIALALAWWSHRWARRHLSEERPAPGETARLRTRVRWEAGVAAVVVIVSGVLSSVTPARDDWAPVAMEHTTIGPYEVTVEVAPARLGPQSFRITVLPDADDTAQPQEIEVALRLAEGPVADVDVTFPYRIPGELRPGHPTPVTFVSSFANVPATGAWDVSITVVASRLEQFSGSVTYEVR